MTKMNQTEEAETTGPKPFDLRTHVRDPRGNIIREQPYVLKCSRERGRVFVRDGKEFREDGRSVDMVDEIKDAELVAKAAADRLEELRKIKADSETPKSVQFAPEKRKTGSN